VVLEKDGEDQRKILLKRHKKYEMESRKEYPVCTYRKRRNAELNWSYIE
jgi:hypothetical protein